MCKSNYKLAIVIVDDGEVSPGKATALTAEATIKLMSSGDVVTKQEVNWLKEGPNNIVLQASYDDVLDIMTKSIENGVRILPVTEQEFTSYCLNKDNVDIIKRPVIKALAIGPDKSNKLNKIIGNLKLYKH